MISIILPVYNGEKYLATAIDSIINQTEGDFELIIVNDCSTDKTVSIVQEYMIKDKRINLITNRKNMRLPASLNIGFKSAKGELLTWTSDDNVLYPKMLEKLSNKILEGNEFVYADMDYIGPSGEILPNESHIGENVWYSNYVGACFMYTRKVYKTIGEYDTTAFLVEDYDYWLRILSKYKFEFINEKLYGYRLHESSLSGSRRNEIAKKRIELLNKYMLDDNIEKGIKDKICVQLANTYYDLGDRNEVKKYLRYLKANNINEFLMTTKSTRMNLYLNKKTIELLRNIKKEFNYGLFKSIQ
jgi:glycosyltransferase involved in cell wall biosynthesis